MSEPRTLSEMLAERFHETYERLAPTFGYRTRDASAVPWSDVPAANKALMTAVVQELRDTGYVVVPFPPDAAATPTTVPASGAGAEREVG